MVVSMYDIPLVVSFKWYTLCGPRVYNYRFTKICGFPMELKGLIHNTQNKDQRRSKSVSVLFAVLHVPEKIT